MDNLIYILPLIAFVLILIVVNTDRLRKYFESTDDEEYEGMADYYDNIKDRFEGDTK